jgi:hypothetical protein
LLANNEFVRQSRSEEETEQWIVNWMFFFEESEIRSGSSQPTVFLVLFNSKIKQKRVMNYDCQNIRNLLYM